MFRCCAVSRRAAAAAVAETVPVMGVEAGVLGLGQRGFVHHPQAVTTQPSQLLTTSELRRMDADEWRRLFQQTPFLRNGDYFYRSNYANVAAPRFATLHGSAPAHKLQIRVIPLVVALTLYAYMHDYFSAQVDGFLPDVKRAVQRRHQAKDDAITTAKVGAAAAGRRGERNHPMPTLALADA